MKKWFKKHKKAIMWGAGAAALGVAGIVMCAIDKNNRKTNRSLFVTYGLNDGEFGDEDPVGETMPDIYGLVDKSKTENFLACKDNLIQTAHDNDMTIRFSTNWIDTGK